MMNLLMFYLCENCKEKFLSTVLAVIILAVNIFIVLDVHVHLFFSLDFLFLKQIMYII